MNWFTKLFRRKPKPTITVDTSWRADAETQVQIAALIARQRIYGTQVYGAPVVSCVAARSCRSLASSGPIVEKRRHADAHRDPCSPDQS